jgi:hypothetical protein
VITPVRRGSWLWIAVFASLAISLAPWGYFVLYPFKLFTTWVHESSHALVAVIVGGEVSSVTLQPDTSGLTESAIPNTRAARASVASAGYLGAAVVGCLLLAAARAERRAQHILTGIGLLMLVTLIAWVRNLFGAIIVLAWAGALLTIARRRLGNTARFLLSLLAIQVAMNAVYDIRVLFVVGGASDAVTMARLFVLPASFWAGLWMLTSVALIAGTLWATRGGR